MTAPHADRIIADYLKRLDAELSPLPRGRRREIRTEIEEHIAEARAALSEEETDTAVHEILDRLGEPEEIAAEASRRFGVSAAKAGPLEITALLLIGPMAVVVPFITWVAGALLVWRSGCWTSRDKNIGVYGPLVVALLILLVSAFFGPFVIFGILLGGIVMALGSAIFLAVRLGRRLPVLAWAGVAVVAIIVVLPAAITVVPAQTTAFIGGDGAPGGQVPHGGKGCGGFYATMAYANGVGGKATASVGLCWEGGRVRKTWGPDCFVDTPALVQIKTTCSAQVVSDGSEVVVQMQSNASAATAPLLGGRSDGGFWEVLGSGTIQPPCTQHICVSQTGGRPSGR